jgi:cobalamin biosynthesis Co2+ chelatase CbiK
MISKDIGHSKILEGEGEQFRLEHQLDKGKFGIVYKCNSSLYPGLDLAIKQIKKTDLVEDKIRIDREIQIL